MSQILADRNGSVSGSTVRTAKYLHSIPYLGRLNMELVLKSVNCLLLEIPPPPDSHPSPLPSLHPSASNAIKRDKEG
jgi:hypothetical protein